MPLQLLCTRDCPLWTKGEPCEVQLKLKVVLRDVFHYEGFLPGQLEAILPVAHGRDVLVRMRTGGGKSLCMYLVPLAISAEALGIVVSPLIGLIEQQVQQLSSVGVAAIHGYNSGHIDDIKAGKFRFVFISPETAESTEWRKMFSDPAVDGRIAVIAVDEAHCISEWGKDFRKAFKEVGGLRAFFETPFMALTASAPPLVQSEIISSLFLSDPVIVSVDINRRNLFISASVIKSLDRDLHGLAEMLQGCIGFIIPKSIIYVKTKDMAWKVYNFLSRESAKHHYVGVYHASLTESTKCAIYQDFRSGNSSLSCLIATVAFGMGMDIPDVEIVVVYGTPATTCQLYQLFGRAGRGGMPARVHLFHSTKVKNINKDIEAFLCGSCRRQSLLSSVGGSLQGNHHEFGCCDLCTPKTVNSRLNILSYKVTKRRPKRVRKAVSPNLEAKLKAAREEVMEEHPCLKMVGVNFLCPDSSIKKLCEEANFNDDMQKISVAVRSELKDKFCAVLHHHN